MTASTKTILITLGVGAAVGGLTVATVRNLAPSALAQSTNNVRTYSSGPAVENRTASTVINTESMAALRNLDASFAELASYVSPSVVHIRSSNQTSSRDMLGNLMMPGGGVGTGVILRNDGWIVTNDHVVGGFENVTVVLRDGREFKGTVRRDPDNDIAVVKIDAKDLTAATFGDSGDVRPGQFAMAVGSPFDLDNTVTFGHVSALARNRVIPDPRRGRDRFYPDLIQTDAAINQGNSGGPLFNVNGEVIGINSAIASATGGSNGIGFAIPSNLARMLAETLIEKGKITRAAMGLGPEDLKEFRKKELKLEGGARVAEVRNDSPAAVAGLKQDDIIVRIGDVTVRGQMDVRLAMYKYAPGSTVDVEYLRGSERRTTKVTLSEFQKEQTRWERERTGRTQDGETRPFRDLEDRMREFFQGEEQGPRGADEVPPVREGQARLGIGIADTNAASRKQFEIPERIVGAVVTSVEPGSVGERMGLKEGHVITRFGDKTIRTATDLTNAVKGVKWGDKVRIRSGKYTNGTTVESDQEVTFR